MSGNTDLVAKGYQAFAAGDVDTVLAMIDPSITVYKLLGTITSSVEPAQIFEAGEHVVQVGRTRGTVNATGAAFDVAEVHVWELRDGKAVSLRSYIDTPAMLAALDA